MTHPLIAELRRRAAIPSLATDEACRFPTTPPPPLDEDAIARAEALLGRPLPPLLRDAYRHVGNGGFGPGYGLLPLIVPAGSTKTESVVDLYAVLRSSDPEDPSWSWPPHLVPFCEWGCAIRSCIDASSSEGAIVTFDPNVHEPGEPVSTALAETHGSLEAWFSDWLAGRRIWDLMFEPDPSRASTGINPVTKEPFSFVPMRMRRS